VGSERVRDFKYYREKDPQQPEVYYTLMKYVFSFVGTIRRKEPTNPVTMRFHNTEGTSQLVFIMLKKHAF